MLHCHKRCFVIVRHPGGTTESIGFAVSVYVSVRKIERELRKKTSEHERFICCGSTSHCFNVYVCECVCVCLHPFIGLVSLPKSRREEIKGRRWTRANFIQDHQMFVCTGERQGSLT